MRVTSFAAGLAAAVLVGCSPGKELPTKPPDPTGQPADPPPAPVIPTKSEPAARDLVAKAVAAHTKNNPARLDKLRAVRMALSGRMAVDARQWVPVTRRMAGEWPDKFRGTWAPDAPGLQAVNVFLSGTAGTVRGATDAPRPLTGSQFQEARWDTTALLWVPLLVPLAEPGTVVYAAGDATIDDKPYRTLKASAPGYPVWSLAFAPDTGLLTRITYDGLEAGLPVTKTLVLTDHAERDGMLVPQVWDMYHAGKPVETGKLTELTFPEKLDPAEFKDQ